MMSTHVQPYIVSFPEGFDEQAEFELPYRGYLPDVIVGSEDGTRHRLTFIDTARLQQGLADNVRTGRHYFTEPGLIVLPEVTSEAVRRAVQGLWDEGALLPDRCGRDGTSPTKG
jgi:hypothetical protein